MNILERFLNGEIVLWVDGDRTELNELLDSHNVMWMSRQIFSEFDCNHCYIEHSLGDCTFSDSSEDYTDQQIMPMEDFLTAVKSGQDIVDKPKFEIGDLVKYNGIIGVVLIIDSMNVGVGVLGDFDGHDLGGRAPKQFEGKCWWCEKRYLVKLPSNKVV